MCLYRGADLQLDDDDDGDSGDGGRQGGRPGPSSEVLKTAEQEAGERLLTQLAREVDGVSFTFP